MPTGNKPFNGRIRNVESIRDFARDMFVYGLKSKSEYTEKSDRSHDEYTRQLGDWFQECLQTRTVEVENKRKNVKYLSLDCRDYAKNPLYQMWKGCSFTKNEIVFFFSLLERLSDKKEAQSIGEIMATYDEIHRASGFTQDAAQKWIQNKGLPLGIVVRPKRGRFTLAPIYNLSELQDLLLYYSEIAPGGVLGSFILDKQDQSDIPFRYKQHFAGQAFDCEIICKSLYAIKENQDVQLQYYSRGQGKIETSVFPVKVYSSTQNGRQYLIAWDEENKRFSNYRIDYIKKMDLLGETTVDCNAVRHSFKEIGEHIWGVSIGEGILAHVELYVTVGENEGYIIDRLYREKRNGTVSPVKDNPGIFKYETDVYDAHEMFPWIRSFIGRIVDLNISDKELEKLFWDGVSEMYDIYWGDDQT